MTEAKKASPVLASAAVLLVIAASFYHACFKVTNEIGPIGADKAGRQIFLQSLQHYMGEPLGLNITSEWADSSFLGRLVIQEPMRTTIRFEVASTRDAPDPKTFVEFLELPYPRFFAEFNPPPDASISLREDHEILLADFYHRLDELGVATVGEMFACLGFRRFELYHGQRAVLQSDLPQVHRPNVKWVGSK